MSCATFPSVRNSPPGVSSIGTEMVKISFQYSGGCFEKIGSKFKFEKFCVIPSFAGKELVHSILVPLDPRSHYQLCREITIDFIKEDATKIVEAVTIPLSMLSDMALKLRYTADDFRETEVQYRFQTREVDIPIKFKPEIKNGSCYNIHILVKNGPLPCSDETDGLISSIREVDTHVHDKTFCAIIEEIGPLGEGFEIRQAELRREKMQMIQDWADKKELDFNAFAASLDQEGLNRELRSTQNDLDFIDLCFELEQFKRDRELSTLICGVRSIVVDCLWALQALQKRFMRA
jgi:hypothetical protein